MQTSEFTGAVLDGHSGLLGAMGWMFGVSLLLTLLLGWIPFIGPFIGPIVGGYIGGRRAGSAARALLAAILPAALLTALMFAIAGLAAAMSHLPVVGAVGTIIAGAIGVIVLVHNALLFVAALIGGALR